MSTESVQQDVAPPLQVRIRSDGTLGGTDVLVGDEVVSDRLSISGVSLSWEDRESPLATLFVQAPMLDIVAKAELAIRGGRAIVSVDGVNYAISPLGIATKAGEI